ncbi:hypothetical protein [Candidatus Williamhamiltonella defendens]|uniref:hypothetical protein n=1 Tax=Candidatus Williamhamiltonella defendens TaxID=138072 RepID=UPI0016518960|nr:hypothetical protein [Candidatus Hamiltonella defensa]
MGLALREAGAILSAVTNGTDITHLIGPPIDIDPLIDGKCHLTYRIVDLIVT